MDHVQMMVHLARLYRAPGARGRLERLLLCCHVEKTLDIMPPYTIKSPADMTVGINDSGAIPHRPMSSMITCGMSISPKL